MKALFERLHALYVDPDLQFRFVLYLVLLICVESVFVGQGFMKLIALSQDWQRAELVRDFFVALLWVLIPLVVVNVGIGFYWSVKLARPLKCLEKGIRDFREGRMDPITEVGEKDAMKDLVLSFNEMVARLKPLLTRDRRLVLEVLTDLDKAHKAKGEELQKILLEASSKLSIVNAHFFKGGLKP